MNKFSSQQKFLAIQRITALWGFAECGLGGFLHAFHLPFSGVLVGGFSIFFITMIAYFSDRVWRDLSFSLLVVLAVKLAVSPHSPITAYVAVAFQGLMGMILYQSIGIRKVSILLLGAITFLESAFQKFIILTVLFGKSLWEAIDLYGNAVAGKLGTTLAVSSSTYVISIYSGIYLFAGVMMAVFIIQILPLIKGFDLNQKRVFLAAEVKSSTQKKKTKNRVIIFTATIAAIVIALMFWGDGIHPLEKGLYLVLRSTLALLIYYLIVGPLLFKLLKKVLSKKSSETIQQVDQALFILPYLRTIAKQALQDAKKEKGNSIKWFLTFLLMYTLQFDLEGSMGQGE